MTELVSGEGVYEVVEVDAPPCFGFRDDLDPSCSKRCQFRVECLEEQEGLKPECFSKLHDESIGDCQACILASQCVEEQMAQEAKEMVKRKLKVRRRVTTPEPDPVEEIEDENEGDAVDYTEMRVAELREELDGRGLETAGRKAVLVERLMEDDEADHEPEPEPPPKPKRKATRRRTKKAPVRAKPVPEPEPEAPDEAQDAFSIEDLFQKLEAGQTVAITRLAECEYAISAGDAVATAPVKKGKGLRGDAYWSEVLTGEYYEFMNVDCGEGKPWTEMSVDEKYEFADDLDITWDEADDDRVNLLRMIQSLFKELGVEKYKDEYKSKASRDALR